jgi:heme-degrading monooxygenase HmoA
VIIRVTRSRIIPGHEDQVIEVMRRLSASMGDSIAGLHSASFGRAMDDDQVMSFVAITEWDSIEAIKAVYGDAWADHTILPGAAEYILETTVEHCESTLEEVSAYVVRRRLGAPAPDA